MSFLSAERMSSSWLVAITHRISSEITYLLVVESYFPRWEEEARNQSLFPGLTNRNGTRSLATGSTVFVLVRLFPEGPGRSRGTRTALAICETGVSHVDGILIRGG